LFVVDPLARLKPPGEDLNRNLLQTLASQAAIQLLDAKLAGDPEGPCELGEEPFIRGGLNIGLLGETLQ